MTKTLKLITSITACLLLAGCSETPTMYDNPHYKGEPMKIAEGIYFKKVYIQGIYALLQCDKDGNIIHNQNVNTGQQQGKVFVSSSILTPSANTQMDSSSINEKFNFKCSDINDCYNQVMIVKNSLNK